MIKYPINNFRGLKQGLIIEVLEGEGTEESVARIVYYIYSEDGNYIGKIDSSPEEDTNN
jgi:hypothetical protein